MVRNFLDDAEPLRGRARNVDVFDGAGGGPETAGIAGLNHARDILGAMRIDRRARDLAIVRIACGENGTPSVARSVAVRTAANGMGNQYDAERER